MKKKNLLQTVLFISVFLMMHQFAIAQIVYTDVMPDDTLYCQSLITTSCSDTFKLDLNNDGNIDYNFTFSYHYIGSCSGGAPPKFSLNAKVMSANPNAYFDIYSSNVYPSSLNYGYQIDSSLNWAGFYGSLRGFSRSNCSSGTTYGNWISPNDMYLPLKLSITGNNYFGWIKIRINQNSGVLNKAIIKDYAYNSVPNQPILAGETTCTTPTITLSASGPLSFCTGDSVKLTANGTGYQYQWKKNGVNITGATLKNYLAKTAGKYKCIATNSCGSKTSKADTVKVPCRNSDAYFNIASDGLEHLSVYPNPATNSVTIKIPSDEGGEIQIVNLFGRIVETHNYASLRDGELQIDVAKFPAEMYVVRWSIGENFQTEKFSVMH